MIQRFTQTSIRRKLTAFMAGTTTLTLLLATLAIGTYEAVTFRRALEQRLTIVADIVGRNTTAALAFEDQTVAGDVLQALGAEPGIETGAIFDRNGRVFATYRAPEAGQWVPIEPGPDGSRISGRWLVVVRPVVLTGDRIGTVYLRSSLGELFMRLLGFAGVTLLVVVGCSAVALAVSAGLQRTVLRPILDLAHTARLVTSDRNFGLRAAGAGPDEVGMLVQDFNRMLAEIERQDRQLREQQESLTQEVANRTAALVAANEQLTESVHRVEHHAEQIQQLTQLGQLLQSCLNVDEVFRVLCNQMPRLFPNDAGTLTLLRSSRNLMETMAVWGEKPPQQRVFAPDECWAFRRGRPHYVAEVNSPLRCAHFTSADGPVTFCVPMLAQGDNVGSIQFTFTKAEPSEHNDDYGTTMRSTRAQLAIALAEQAALALANLRLREALRSQSIVDPLTGLYNRRYLETMLERECRRAERAGRPLSLMVSDIDHFKQVNDTWGHDGGDAVLREIGALLGSSFRGDDIACRFGGEEFVIVLPEAPLDAALARAEDLRRLVHRLGVQHRGHSLGPVTISIGLAAMPDHGTTPDELIGAADRALYEAKRAGRDRVVCAPLPNPAAAPA